MVSLPVFNEGQASKGLVTMSGSVLRVRSCHPYPMTSQAKSLSHVWTIIKLSKTSFTFSKVKRTSVDERPISIPAPSGGCAAVRTSVTDILPSVASGMPGSVVAETEALQGITDADHDPEVLDLRSLRRMRLLDLIDAVFAGDHNAMDILRSIHATDSMEDVAVSSRMSSRRNTSDQTALNAPNPTYSSNRVKPRAPFANEACLSDFIVHAKLGAGAYGVVYRVEDKLTNQTMALKIINKNGAAYRDLRQFRVELEAMKRVMGDHHCMQVEAGFQDEQCLYLALAFHPGGDLHDLIRTYRWQTLPVDHVRVYIAELLVGVHHLHRQGIIHRDLKPSNVLIDSQGHLVIADLGMAKVFMLDDPDSFSPYNPTGTFACLSQQPYLSGSLCGTTEYMAPEIILGVGYGFAVDFWAVGVMLYEMLVGRPPWTTDDGPCIANAITRLEPFFFYDFHPEAKDLLQKMLHKDVKSRPLYEYMLHHPFFASIDWKQVEKRSFPPVHVPPIKEYDTSSTLPIPFDKYKPSSDPLPNFNFISPTLKRQRRHARSPWRIKAKKSIQSLQKIAVKIFSHRPTPEEEQPATTTVDNDRTRVNCASVDDKASSNCLFRYRMRCNPPLSKDVHKSFVHDIDGGEQPHLIPNDVRDAPLPSPAAISPAATLVGSSTHQKGIGTSPNSGFKRWVNRLLHPIPVVQVLVGDDRKTLDLTA